MLPANPISLRILSAVTLCAGVLAFLKGLRFRRTTARAGSRDTAGQSRSDQSPNAALESSEVIRLSTNTVSGTSTSMTQQQRIAAAMQRAGMPNPAAWSTPHADAAGASSTAVLEAPPSTAENVPTSPSPHPSRVSAAWMGAGALLVLMSFYMLLLTLRP